MIILENGVYKDSQPEFRNGSWYRFGTDEDVEALLNELNVDGVLKQRLLHLVAHCKSNQLEWISGKSINAVLAADLGIGLNSSRGFLAKIRQANLLKVAQFESSFKNIAFYQFNVDVTSLDDSDEEAPRAEYINKMVEAFKGEREYIENRATKPANVKDDLIYAVKESALMGGLFGLNQITENLKIDSFLGTTSMKLSNVQRSVHNTVQLRLLESKNGAKMKSEEGSEAPEEVNSKDSVSVQVIAKTTSDHKSGVVSIDDLPFLNMVIHLTLAYHQANKGSYLRTEEISTLTPIDAVDIFALGGKKYNRKNQKSWDRIDDLMFKLESSKFTIQADSERDKYTVPVSKRKNLFNIEREVGVPQRKDATYVGKRTKTYWIRWDHGVIKEFFKQNFLFLYPAEIYQYSGLVYALYAEVRKQLKHKKSLTFDIRKLMDLMACVDMSEREAAQLFLKYLIKDFKIKETDIVRNGKSAQALVKAIQAKHTLGGVDFVIVGDQLHKSSPKLWVKTEGDLARIWLASQPASERMRLKSTEYLKEYLDSANIRIGDQNAVAFPDMAVVADRLKSLGTVNLNSEDLSSVRSTALDFRIVSRKFVATIYASATKYEIHRYQSGKHYATVIGDIAQLTNNSHNYVQHRCSSAYPKLAYLMLKDKELTPDYIKCALERLAGAEIEYDRVINDVIGYFSFRVRSLRAIQSSDTRAFDALLCDAVAASGEYGHLLTENNEMIEEAEIVEKATNASAPQGYEDVLEKVGQIFSTVKES
ncbi:replication initiator protein RctB domain-containing protein [Vibrio breoganii]